MSEKEMTAREQAFKLDRDRHLGKINSQKDWDAGWQIGFETAARLAAQPVNQELLEALRTFRRLRGTENPNPNDWIRADIAAQAAIAHAKAQSATKEVMPNVSINTTNNTTKSDLPGAAHPTETQAEDCPECRRLREALQKYGEHRPTCPRSFLKEPCDCGFQAALAPEAPPESTYANVRGKAGPVTDVTCSVCGTKMVATAVECPKCAPEAPEVKK